MQRDDLLLEGYRMLSLLIWLDDYQVTKGNFSSTAAILALGNVKGELSTTPTNRFVLTSSPRGADTQEIISLLISKIKPLEEAKFVIDDEIWLSNIPYKKTKWFGGIHAWPGDDINQRALLLLRGPTSSHPSRFFDSGKDFSKVLHPDERIAQIRQDEKIKEIQTKCEGLLSKPGNKGKADELSKQYGLKPAKSALFAKKS